MTAFEEFLNNSKIKFMKNEPMSRHTSFHIGGAAEYFVLPCNENELQSVIKYSKENAVPFTVVGKGSNLVVSDDGIEGAVICTLNINEIRLCENGEVFAASGASLEIISCFFKFSIFLTHLFEHFFILCNYTDCW